MNGRQKGGGKSNEKSRSIRSLAIWGIYQWSRVVSISGSGRVKTRRNNTWRIFSAGKLLYLWLGEFVILSLDLSAIRLNDWGCWVDGFSWSQNCGMANWLQTCWPWNLLATNLSCNGSWSFNRFSSYNVRGLNTLLLMYFSTFSSSFSPGTATCDLHCLWILKFPINREPRHVTNTRLYSQVRNRRILQKLPKEILLLVLGQIRALPQRVALSNKCRFQVEPTWSNCVKFRRRPMTLPSRNCTRILTSGLKMNGILKGLRLSLSYEPAPSRQAPSTVWELSKYDRVSTTF